MNRSPVKSSSVVSLAYENGVLEVEYPGGRIYSADITPDQYAALATADSLGKAMNALKAEVAFTKVEEE